MKNDENQLKKNDDSHRIPLRFSPLSRVSRRPEARDDHRLPEEIEPKASEALKWLDP